MTHPTPTHRPLWTISVNGQIGDEFTSTISVMDRGFLFGDSIYEVTSTKNGVLMFWEEHFERLTRTAQGLGIQLTMNMESLYLQVARTVAASRIKKEIFTRIIFTRGFNQNLSLYPSDGRHTPNWIIMVQSLPDQVERFTIEGMNLFIAEQTRRNARNAMDPNLKTGNFLNSIFASFEAHKHSFDDAVMLNAHGFVTEGTNFNIWGVKDGTIHTPPLESGLLLGITRQQVIKVATRENLPLREQQMRSEDLLAMDEVFVTSATRGVMPVHQLNQKTFNIQQRPVTERLRRLYREHCEAYARDNASRWAVQK